MPIVDPGRPGADCRSAGERYRPDGSLTKAVMISGWFARWLYRGRRQGRLARLLNWAAARIGSAGLAPDYLVTLQVQGRRSGRVSSFPMVVAVLDGERYLVSMLGHGVAWVRNLEAAGGRAVLLHGIREPIHLEAVPVASRPSILKEYLRRAPGARPHIPVDKDAPLAEFERIAAAYPVFRVRRDSATR